MGSKQYIQNLTTDKGQKCASLTMIPKRNVHHILHYLYMQQINAKKTGEPLPSFPNGRHSYFLRTYYKSFCILNRLKGTALSTGKIQFIKKPKNPV